MGVKQSGDRLFQLNNLKRKIVDELFFLPFVKFIKVFDEKYFVSRNPNKEIVFFWTKVTCKK
ncbi:hypothetical protein, partial [Streptococcus suis]|uniref:hypothetical protein n=2 Tax=Streptococcus suis TaxID=1307 RepID=UPI002FCBDC63